MLQQRGLCASYLAVAVRGIEKRVALITNVACACSSTEELLRASGHFDGHFTATRSAISRKFGALLHRHFLLGAFTLRSPLRYPEGPNVPFLAPDDLQTYHNVVNFIFHGRWCNVLAHLILQAMTSFPAVWRDVVHLIALPAVAHERF